MTVKLTPLLATPLTVTRTFPVVAPLGTGTTMLGSLQLVGVATVPLNVTVLVPLVAPKLAPVIVTDVPAGPDVGLKLVMLGGNVTVKFTPLLTTPLIETTTFPVVAALGTGAKICVSLQLVVLAVVPLKLRTLVLVPTVGPKFVPLTVTAVPTGPDVGLMLVIFGGGVTVKGRPLLGTPPTVTTTLTEPKAIDGTGTSRLVALQFVGVAIVALKVTVLVPCVVPKFRPVIVTIAPTGP